MDGEGVDVPEDTCLCHERGSSAEAPTPHTDAPQSTPSRGHGPEPDSRNPSSHQQSSHPGTPEEEKTPVQGHFFLSLKLPCRPVTFVASEPQTPPG